MRCHQGAFLVVRRPLGLFIDADAVNAVLAKPSTVAAAPSAIWPRRWCGSVRRCVTERRHDLRFVSAGPHGDGGIIRLIYEPA